MTWRYTPKNIQDKILIMYLIINSNKTYTEEQYYKYIKPVIDFNPELTFFDIPDQELPE